MSATLRSWLDIVRGQVIDARAEPRQMAGGEQVRLVVDGREHPARILDLSDDGAMVAAEVALDEGRAVLLHRLDRPPLRGQVRWSHDGRLGIRFDHSATRAPDELRDDT
ncbi:PilZ domain-containing protein [Sphingomonas mesophila]|uniref:PilZ domain-containing protein n=1 Tax=Sphingomonas mesophila TaxID=2303576 RepID=UPI000E579726|nr:PilZ domain-containing protein [Sphingomonas mesophila]